VEGKAKNKQRSVPAFPGVKLEQLSQRTAVVHVANNNYKHHDLATHLRIYVNGEIMPRSADNNISWS